MRGISSCPSSTRLGEEGAHSTKSAVQVQQEAAHVIAQGGGIQCCFPQKPDGSLALWQAGLMERLARFCRLRERHCFRSRTVPQVALLHSTFDYYRRTGALFMGVDGVLKVHLLSTAGPHGDPQVHVFDELPPLGPLTVSIRLPSAPARVSLDPQGDELPFVYGAGRLTVTVPRLTVHAIISVD